MRTAKNSNNPVTTPAYIPSDSLVVCLPFDSIGCANEECISHIFSSFEYMLDILNIGYVEWSLTGIPDSSGNRNLMLYVKVYDPDKKDDVLAGIWLYTKNNSHLFSDYLIEGDQEISIVLNPSASTHLNADAQEKLRDYYLDVKNHHPDRFSI